jgi:hypothetical protein
LLFEDPDGIRIVANFLPGKGYLADAGKAQESESRFACKASPGIPVSANVAR